MRYISTFSGIEAATVAWEPLGWEPVAFCENAEFPSAVLEYHFPDIPNLGDITKVDWGEYRGAVDLVVGGSPCQSFSFAGKREGLNGESRLMFEYVRCIQEVMPRWLVWENVPGALASGDGEDFRCLLRELDVLGYGLAWRILDAQFFGVAQRRRRVFVVGSLGEQRAGDVLFDSGMLCGRPKADGEAQAGQMAAGGEGRFPSEGCWGVSWSGSGKAIVKDGMPCLTTASGQRNGVLRFHDNGFELRHITPVEAERLQGFPDDWTKVPYRGESKEGCHDTPRYKAIGNSMAVPVMRWAGERIDAYDDR